MIDDLVYAWMNKQEAKNPDEDAGDLTITWQDDSILVTATQKGRTGVGRSATQALANLMENND